MASRSKRGHPQQKSSQRPAGQIRIIAGRWRGRKLPVANSEGLRPTTDRVKETLFNWLAPHIVDSRCLDLFAGSGSLGFEALSRGADETVFLEKEAKIANILQQNLQQLSADNGKVEQTDSLQYLKNPGQPFGIVFIDPPFRKDLLSECCELLEQNHWLAEGALIYIEREQELCAPRLPQSWELLKDKTAGQVSYQLYQRRVNS
nr:16S rRNA (guanine(966)-N(2))-methyltransferase RsmD [Dongshaea marina]